ncbi:MAG TPA: sigma factor-like helix-turn-helix DNA-binding protein [Anaerovoracaceae bacterium]|nr:sigma factor-like helix-turn-helix DNA-binding protein [Anaerovoracaceae bacterium]
MIKDVEYASLLFDFYGKLLPQKQQEVMDYYHEDNLSLSEIAENLNITRQGVHYILRSAEKTLKEYEEKLKLIDRYLVNIKKVKSAKENLDNLDNVNEKEKIRILNELKNTFDSFLE